LNQRFVRRIAMTHSDQLDRLVFITTMLSALVVNLPW
jgi:hypothetical protein